MEKVVKMAPREVLLSIAYIEALAEAVRGLNLSRRKTVDWLAETLIDWLIAGGAILDWNGNPVEIDDDLIELVYGDDVSCTGASTIKAIQPGSRKRRSRATMAGRLGLYYVAFVIIGKPIVIGD
jgi:hypothetical protein